MTIHQIRPGVGVLFPDGLTVSMRLDDPAGTFRVDDELVRPEPHANSIFDWTDLPGTDMEVRFVRGEMGVAEVRVKSDG